MLEKDGGGGWVIGGLPPRRWSPRSFKREWVFPEQQSRTVRSRVRGVGVRGEGCTE